MLFRSKPQTPFVTHRRKTHYKYSMTKMAISACMASMLIILCFDNLMACSMDGCKEGMCFTSGSELKCSDCIAGYYKSTTLENCNQCSTRCMTCTSYDVCTSCRAGYFQDAGSLQCNSCPVNCLSCKSSAACIKCEDGSSLTDAGICGNGSTGGDQQSTSSSMTGQIVGYCVSGVVVILCCVITVLYQKKKQEDEEEARNQLKEQRRNRNGDFEVNSGRFGTHDYDIQSYGTDNLDGQSQEPERYGRMQIGLNPDQHRSDLSTERGIPMISNSTRLKADPRIISDHTNGNLNSMPRSQLVRKDLSKSSNQAEMSSHILENPFVQNQKNSGKFAK